MDLVAISRRLAREVDRLEFGPPVAYVYDPLVYAREPHEAYLSRYGRGPKDVLLLGMNPGPFGMAQTGVPFGDAGLVRGWLGIEGRIDRPPREHPKRPVLGFACGRSEVSGRRFWGFARDRFGTPERFFERLFVANYCPLVFVEESGRNRTPDKLPAAEREPLFAACDRALAEVVAATGASWVLGIGRFAEARAARLFEGSGVAVSGMLHPSPASPAANAGWAEAAGRALASAGLELRAPSRPAGRAG